MNIRDTQRAAVTERLSSHILAHGLARSSLRELAAAAGVSDRMLLYYFNDKSEILSEALTRIAGAFVVALDAALPEERLPPDILLARALKLMRSPEVQPSMRLWLEIVTAAARDQPPFPALAASILDGFLHWIDQRLDISDDRERADAAALTLATIDGIALFDLVDRQGLANSAERRINQRSLSGR